MGYLRVNSKNNNNIINNTTLYQPEEYGPWYKSLVAIFIYSIYVFLVLICIWGVPPTKSNRNNSNIN